MENLELKVNQEVKKEEVENLVQETGTVTNEKIEQSLNYDVLSQAEKEAIDEFNKKIDINDATQILQYGAQAQTKISKFSDSVLDDVKTRNAGEVGDLLASLVSEIKSFDTDISKSNATGIEKLFFNAKKQLDKITAKYSKIETNIDRIEKDLEGHKLQMLKDINIFDTMYEKNLEYFKELSLYIIAGERKLEELRTVVLPELQQKARESGEQLDAQKVQDMENTINRFEKKIYDLKTTRIISIQMAPQIRMLQNNEAELVEKIQGSLTNTIPLWKNQIVLALGINNAKQALGAQKAVTDLTNDMLQKNSELLKQGSIEIAEESERAIVDVATLQKTNKDHSPNSSKFPTISKALKSLTSKNIKKLFSLFQFTHPSNEEQKIENEEYDKYIDTSKIFTMLALIGAEVLTENIEKELMRNLKFKLVKNKFLAKHEFIRYKFWFENNFSFIDFCINSKKNSVTLSKTPRKVTRQKTKNFTNSPFKAERKNKEDEQKNFSIKDLLYNIWVDEKENMFNFKEFLDVLRVSNYSTKSEIKEEVYFDIIFGE